MGDPPWPAEVKNTKKQDLAVLNDPKDETKIEEGGEDEDGSSNDDDDATLINESIIEFFTSKGQGEEDEVEQLLAAVESAV